MFSSHVELDERYIIVEEVNHEDQAVFASLAYDPQIGDVIEFRSSSMGDGQLARIFLNGIECGYLHVSAMRSIFFVGAVPAKAVFRSFVVAKPVDAEAVFAGVPIEDVYA